MFAVSLHVKQFYLTRRLDPINCNHSKPEWTWERWQLKGIEYFQKLQIIRWFNVIFRTLVVGVVLFCQDAVCVFYGLSWLDCPVMNIQNDFISIYDDNYSLTPLWILGHCVFFWFSMHNIQKDCRLVQVKKIANFGVFVTQKIGKISFWYVV